jgi:hypothetical protein
MRPRCLSRLASVAVLAVSMGLTSTANAQTDEARASARAAATQGLHALQEGRYKDALDLCTRAEALMHAPTHLLLIARAQTKLGHLVEAQEAYIKIVREHLAPNAPRAFVDAQATASDEQSALTPRVPTLKVDVEGGSASDVQITLDGAPLPSALVGMASPVNPGSHTLAVASGSATAEPVTVTVAEGTKQSVTLTLKATPIAAEAPAQAPAPARTTTPAPPPPPRPGLAVAGWVVVGVGVVGLVAGTVFVVKNHAERNDASALCEPSGCPESKRAQISSFDSEADSASALSWVSYGAGAAGLVTGAVLLWANHGRPAPAQSGQVIPWFGRRATGVRVTF